MTGMAGVNGWAGWQWVFLLEGAITIIVGAAAWWVLTEKPQDATWLSSSEKSEVLAELAKDGAAPRSHPGCRYATVNFFGPTAIEELVTAPTTIGWIISGCSRWRRGVPDPQRPAFRQTPGNALPHGHRDSIGSVSLALMGIFLGQGNVIVTIACLFLAISGTASAFPVFWQLPFQMLPARLLPWLGRHQMISNLDGFFVPTFLAA